jgi:hypothetical protein
MNILRHTICLGILTSLVACSEEPAPVSTAELMENPRLLEATMVRCAQNRAESRYVVECINARDAINRVEAVEERSRREEFERQFERKRLALRRTQEAAAEARRRTLEAQRLREEQEYLGLFDPTVDDAAAIAESATTGSAGAASNAPGVELETPVLPDEEQPPAEEIPLEPATDLEAIREELKRRQESNN